MPVHSEVSISGERSETPSGPPSSSESSAGWSFPRSASGSWSPAVRAKSISLLPRQVDDWSDERSVLSSVNASPVGASATRHRKLRRHRRPPLARLRRCGPGGRRRLSRPRRSGGSSGSVAGPMTRSLGWARSSPCRAAAHGSRNPWSGSFGSSMATVASPAAWGGGDRGLASS
jgi:hypothetical protein